MIENYRKRQLVNTLMKGLVFFFTILSLVPLLFILFYLIKQGIGAINWEFLTHLPKPVGESGGGVFNAIVGTIILIVLSTLMAVPLGIGAGIYLAEVKAGKLAYLLRLGTDILQGTPSIVLGVIAYLWVVKPMKSFSALAGSVALAIMMLPMIICSTEETLKLIPYSLKEAALALGVPYYRTILKVILPAGFSGILTGILLGIARIAGETAPLLFTAFGSPYLNLNPLKPISALPLVVFNYASSPYPDWWRQAWGASFVLTVMVLVFNLAAKIGTRKWEIKF
ncbi:MAG: phosphate ABC transporter permease PstA [Candidatus Desulfofervidaceae bacterium]|nr:phosphate ABC transporter permease PstA [Candidatus Desulfofervidaceae bacterium]